MKRLVDPLRRTETTCPPNPPMQFSTLHPRLGRSARVRLSSRGHTTEAAYRSHVASASGSTRRKAFERARSEWALCHGLEPDDGAYLGELRVAALTVKELGEALAVCGQTGEMVSSTVGRLLSRGFIERISADAPRRGGPSFERVREELATAEIELEAVSRRFEADHIVDRRMIGASLRQAVSRAMVARRFLENLSAVG